MGSVKVTKNVDVDKYKYNHYRLEFDSCSEFSETNVSMRKNVIIFAGDMISSVHIDYIKYLN